MALSRYKFRREPLFVLALLFAFVIALTWPIWFGLLAPEMPVPN